MKIAPINLCNVKKAQSFRGNEKSEEKGTNASSGNEIKDAIDRNTKAIENLAEQVMINSYTLYAIEKSKSGSTGFHRDCYSETNSPVSFINYANSHWYKPQY